LVETKNEKSVEEIRPAGQDYHHGPETTMRTPNRALRRTTLGPKVDPPPAGVDKGWEKHCSNWGSTLCDEYMTQHCSNNWGSFLCDEYMTQHFGKNQEYLRKKGFDFIDGAWRPTGKKPEHDYVDDFLKAKMTGGGEFAPWKNHCGRNKWRSAGCANFMKKKGYEIVDGRWQKTNRVDEWKDEEYDYVEDFLNEKMTCDEKGNCRAGRRH